METNISNLVSENAVQPEKIGKIKGGYMVIAESFKLLNKNKSAVLFPLFAAIASGAAILVCVFVVFFFRAGVDVSRYFPGKNVNEILMYVAVFVFYFVTTFIVSFFQAGLAIVVSAQINGKKMSFGEGMNNAGKYAGKIFIWSLIWSTVGILMDIIQNKTKLAGRIAAAIFGVAWGIATFFIVPVLVLENGSVGASLKRSADIFKKKWGETIIANFAASLYFTFFWVLGLAIFLSYLFLASPDIYLIILSAALFAVFTAVVAIVASTVEGIYRVVLYEYAANNKIPQDFSQELILAAMKK